MKRTRIRVEQVPRNENCNRRRLAAASLEEVQAALTLEQGRLEKLEEERGEEAPNKRGSFRPTPDNLRYKRRLVGWLKDHAASLSTEDDDQIQKTATALRGN